jgi:GH24 family phage-related lysozyme (muramidase)
MSTINWGVIIKHFFTMICITSTVVIFIVFFLGQMHVVLGQANCTFSFSDNGVAALRCAEGYVDGCYLDSECFWTIAWGHLVGKDKSRETYDKCCEIAKTLTTQSAETLFQNDIATKGTNYLIGGLSRKGEKFCIGGKAELTQGEFDALVLATYQGAVKFDWFKESKNDMKELVTARTLKYGGKKRVDLFNKLWDNTALDCTIAYLKASDKLKACKNCGALEEVCDAAADKQCFCPKEFLCDSSTLCSTSPICGCGKTAEKKPYCFANELCSSLIACTTSKECGSGRKCVVKSCCTGSKCIARCNTAQGLSFLVENDSTTGSPSEQTCESSVSGGLPCNP